MAMKAAVPASSKPSHLIFFGKFSVNISFLCCHITQPAHRWITIVNVKSLTCPAPRLHHCLGCQFVTRNSWSHSNVRHHSSVSQWYCFLSISMLSNIIDCYLTNLEGHLEALGLKKFVEQHWLVASLFSKSSNPLLALQIFSLTCFRYFTF